MTRCPDTGTLRASLDGEADEAAVHAQTCDACRQERVELRATAAATDAALALLAPPAAAPAPNEAPAPPAQLPVAAAPVSLDAERQRRRGSTWQRRAAAAAAVIVLTSGLVSTPAGREAAASFLSAFRSERVEVVTIDPWSAHNAFFALTEFADIQGLDDGFDIEPAPSTAAAERRVGFEVTLPDPALLPERYGSEPAEIIATEGSEVRVAFDESRLADYLARTEADVAIPDGLGETTLIVRLPSAVALTYRGPDWEQLVVGESGLVTADTEGPLDLEAVRNFLLELPALPPETVRQLQAIDDWRTTLPLPVPADAPAWRDVTVAGHEGVLFDDALASAVVWQADGRVRGVGGVADAPTVQRIAENLAR